MTRFGKIFSGTVFYESPGKLKKVRNSSPKVPFLASLAIQVLHSATRSAANESSSLSTNPSTNIAPSGLQWLNPWQIRQILVIFWVNQLNHYPRKVDKNLFISSLRLSKFYFYLITEKIFGNLPETYSERTRIWAPTWNHCNNVVLHH